MSENNYPQNFEFVKCSTENVFQLFEATDINSSFSNFTSLIHAKKKIKNITNWKDIHNFHRILCEKEFNVTSLWLMDTLDILPLRIYVKNLSARHDLSENFIQSIGTLISSESSDDLTSFVQAGIMTYVVNNRFNSNDDHIMQFCDAALKHIVLDFILTSNEQDCKSRQNALSLIWSSGNVDFQNLQSFCIFFLQNLIQTLKSANNIFLLQENCKERQAPFHMCFLLDRIVKTVEVEDVAELLWEDLSNEKSNLEGCVVLIDSLLRVYEEKSAFIELFTSLLKRSFETTDTGYLRKAVIILRQAVFSSSESISIAHKKWFNVPIFENIVFKIPDNFTLYIMTMTDLLPYENNKDILKMSLNQQVNVPNECQIIFADYIALIRTKLKDLEPKEEPEEIIKKLLGAFEENEKIPAYVFETSLIRKNFFLNEFLPVLLSPRVIPVIPDTKEKFIRILHLAGKIPESSLEKYKVDCAEKARSVYKLSWTK